MNQPNKIITHHAVSAKHHTAQDVSQWHFERWGGYAKSRRKEAPYAGYTYIIEWDGKTTQCRDYDEEGIHCRGQNFSSIGVCFMGNFDNHMPSEAQEEAWVALYEKLSEEYGDLPVYPHRKFAAKSCHGSLLSDDYFSRIVTRTRQLTLIEELKLLISRLQSILTQNRMKG